MKNRQEYFLTWEGKRMEMIILSGLKMIVGRNLRIVSRGVNTFVGIMKTYTRKGWIDCLRLRTFWEGVRRDCKLKMIGD